MPLCPIQCFTCGKYISEYAEEWAVHYAKYKDQSISVQEKVNQKFFSDKNLTRYCCRNNLANAANILEKLKRSHKKKNNQ